MSCKVKITFKDFKQTSKEYFCKKNLPFILLAIISFFIVLAMVFSGKMSEQTIKKIKWLVILLTIFFMWALVTVYGFFKSLKNLKIQFKDVLFMEFELKFINGYLTILNLTTNKTITLFKSDIKITNSKKFYIILEKKQKRSVLIDKTEEGTNFIKEIKQYN